MDSSHPSVEGASNFASTSTASVVSGSVSSTTSSVSSAGASSVVSVVSVVSAGAASSVPPQPTNKDCFEISVLISSAFIKSYLVDNFLHKKE